MVQIREAIESSADSLDLPLALEVLRNQVGQAIEAAEFETIKFEVQEIELELSLELRKELAADGKLSVGFFAATGKAVGSAKAQHKVKLKLSVTNDGRTVDIRDEP
jgi:hypothetical protein